MFVVYKITNLIENKCYIGSSIRVEKRWRQHINTSNNPNSSQYNYPLYKAFRQFGIENFIFEIIADDFETIWEMEEYEQQMIDFYNSVKPNGYNQTRATHSNNLMHENCQKHNLEISQKCAKVDIHNNIIEVYKSYHDAARKNGYDGDSRATSIREVCKGHVSSLNGIYFRDLDNEGNIIPIVFKNSHSKKSLIAISVDTQDELYFESITQAAEKLNTDRTSISKCISGSQRYTIVKGYIIRELDLYGNIIENNIDIDERISEYNKRNPIIDGIRHDIPTWCNIYNIKQATVNARIRRGWSSINAITTPVKGR